MFKAKDNVKMTLEDLNIFAQNLAVKNFNMNLDAQFLIEDMDVFGKCFPVYNEMGNLLDMSHISINSELINVYPIEYIEGVVLHELCHWSLFRHGSPSDDDDSEFVAEMIRVGGSFPNDIPLVGNFYAFRCKSCYKEAGMFQLNEELFLLYLLNVCM